MYVAVTSPYPWNRGVTGCYRSAMGCWRWLELLRQQGRECVEVGGKASAWNCMGDSVGLLRILDMHKEGRRRLGVGRLVRGLAPG